jgi:hypothetical protein
MIVKKQEEADAKIDNAEDSATVRIATSYIILVLILNVPCIHRTTLRQPTLPPKHPPPHPAQPSAPQTTFPFPSATVQSKGRG